MARHRTYRRRRNPFAVGGINKLAVKVGGGLAGGIAAAALPNAISPSFATGWGGVAAALAIAFGGSYITRSMSPDFSEGVLIGGTLQAAGRVSQLLINKNLVSFSLNGMGTYGPMRFPVPIPNYNVGLRSGPSVTPMVPASASAARPMRPSAAPGMGKWGARNSKWAA